MKKKNIKILITGAQFGNKGAQSLLFSVINEIKRKYSESEIYYVPLDDISIYQPEELKMHLVYDDEKKGDCREVIRGTYRKWQAYIERKKIIDEIKNGKIFLLSKVWKEVDVVVDISGYNLASVWPMEINNRFLRYIRSARKRNLPIVLMPQSFGPFEYSDKYKYINGEIKDLLSYVDVICTREQQGVKDLASHYGIKKNVFLYPDAVLVSADIDMKYILKKKYVPELIQLKTDNNVGIVPNEQLFVSGNEEHILNIYAYIIDILCRKRKNIYIFRHSNDMNICMKIYDRNKEKKNVFYIEKDFDCIEYAEFIKQFDFIIASRFHAIVHAYKNFIPAVIVGWSEKYNELASMFDQSQYMYDICNESKEFLNKIDLMINNMMHHSPDEKRCIAEKMDIIRKQSCYDMLWKVLSEVEENVNSTRSC